MDKTMDEWTIITRNKRFGVILYCRFLYLTEIQATRIIEKLALRYGAAEASGKRSRITVESFTK
jgi:hypothetical protein